MKNNNINSSSNINILNLNGSIKVINAWQKIKPIRINTVKKEKNQPKNPGLLLLHIVSPNIVYEINNLLFIFFRIRGNIIQ